MRTATILTCLLLPLTLIKCSCDDLERLSEVPQPGAITGKFCAPSGSEGIGGARVYIITEDDEVFETLSETDGTFNLTELPDGTYTVYLQSGSFRTNVEDVEVIEETVTTLEDEACITAGDPVIRVFEGHDTIEFVLNDIGITDYELIPTHDNAGSRDPAQESWLVEHLQNYDQLEGVDIIFINCGNHEWAFENLPAQQLQTIVDNLRRFVEEGHSIYLSDWSYDLMELLYPDAADWLGEDDVLNAAQHAGDFDQNTAQTLTGNVVDASMVAFLGKSEVSVTLEQDSVAIATSLGEGSTPLITANVDVYAETLFAETSGSTDDDSESDVPAGECAGSCGGQAPSGCWCNAQCVQNGDCCSDYQTTCSGDGSGGANSCQGKCGDGYDPELDCQCNDRCSEFDNCCSDYNAVCEGGGGSTGDLAEVDSCGSACGGYRTWANCQCTPECVELRGDNACCADFEAVCESDYDLTYQEIPILFEYRPTNVSDLESGRIIFTSFHNNQQNAGDLGRVLEGIIFSL